MLLFVFFNVSLGKLGRDGLEVELTGFIDRLKGGGEGKREQPRANLICGQATGWLTSLLAKTGKAVDGGKFGDNSKGDTLSQQLSWRECLKVISI